MWCGESGATDLKVWSIPLSCAGINFLSAWIPLPGCSVRVGAIALNAVLASEAGIGDTVVIFGQGVIGLLATACAAMSGATVVAIDGIERRREVAATMGAHHVLSPDRDTAVTIRELTAGRGADVAIDLSGSYHALREAVRAVGPDSTVVAAGFIGCCHAAASRGGVPSQQGSARRFPDRFGTAAATSPVGSGATSTDRR